MEKPRLGGAGGAAACLCFRTVLPATGWVFWVLGVVVVVASFFSLGRSLGRGLKLKSHTMRHEAAGPQQQDRWDGPTPAASLALLRARCTPASSAATQTSQSSGALWQSPTCPSDRQKKLAIGVLVLELHLASDRHATVDSLPGRCLEHAPGHGVLDRILEPETPSRPGIQAFVGGWTKAREGLLQWCGL